MGLLSGRGLLLVATALALGTWGAAVRAEDTGELFPGVKGVSGEELRRQIEQYDRTHGTPPTETPKPAPVEPTRPPPPSPPPPSPTSQPAPKPTTVAASATPAASATKVATADDSTKTAPPTSAAKAAVDRTAYLKKLSDQTAFIEAYLKKAKVIRDNTREEANRGNNSEAFNQYWLRYYHDQVDSGLVRASGVVRYEQTMMLPATIYRYIYEMADDSAAKARKVAAALDAPPEDQQTADGLAKRLGVVRKGALLGAAEVYALIRSGGVHMDVAGRIYDLLLKEYPSDSEIQASYDHFVKVRNKPKPRTAPRGPGE